MAELGVVEVVVRARLDQLEKDFGQARKSSGAAADRIGDEMSGIGTKADAVGGRIGGIGKAAIAAGGLMASAGIAGKLSEAAHAASNLGEAQNANNVIFGSGAGVIDKFAATSLKTLGLAEITVRDLATGIGGMFNAVGIESARSAEMTTGLITRARDVGSVFNTTAQVVTEAFGSALRGESEPARRFGVFLTADAIAAEAMSSGLVKGAVDVLALGQAQIKAEDAVRKHAVAVKTFGEDSDQATKANLDMLQAQEAVTKALGGQKPVLTEAEKMQAAYAIVMRSTEVAAGDYARTSDSLANKTADATEATKEATASLGESVAPILTKLTSLTTDLMGGFTNLPGPVQTGVAALLGIAVLAGPIGSLIGLFGLLKGALVAHIGFSAAAGAASATSSGGFFAAAAGLWAMMAPIMPIVLAVVALIAIGVVLWRNWDTILAAGQAVFGWLGDVAVSALRFLKDNFLYLLGPIGLVIKHWDTLKAAGGAAVDWVVDKFRGLVGFVSGIPGAIGGALRGAFDGLVNAFRSAWNWIAGRLNGVGFTIPDWVPGIGGRQFRMPQLPILDTGGIVRSPTLALLAANSRPEAVVPLDSFAAMGGRGGNVYITVEGSVMSERDLIDVVDRGFRDLGRTGRRGGL